MENSELKNAKLIKPNWYEFNLEKVVEKYEGDLTYCATFCILGEYAPRAVFHNKNPNRDKNHKDYLLLILRDGNVFVGGIDAEEIEPHRRQVGAYCPNCNEIIYSVNRHDFRSCSCDSVTIDGGKDYIQSSAENLVEIDLITGGIKALKKHVPVDEKLKGLEKKHLEYRIIRYMPDFVRGETVNVGIAVFLEKSIDARITSSIDRIEMIDKNANSSTLALLRNSVSFSVENTAEMFKSGKILSKLIRDISLSDKKRFLLENEADYEDKIKLLFKELID